MNVEDKVKQFLAGDAYAVAGASEDRSKYGNKVLRVYQQHGRKVYPINPNADEVEGLEAYPSVSALPEKVHGLSIVTPSAVTEKVVDEAIAAGIQHIWMQPGAENEAAIRRAEEKGVNVIANGPCVLVVLGFRENA